MKTTIEEKDGKYVVLFDGRLDTFAAAETEKDLQPLNDCEGRDIELDCSGMDYISSSGLRLFLSILKNAMSKGSHVYITGINDKLASIFRMTGFNKLFEFK